jgi:hypothetical protein
MQASLLSVLGVLVFSGVQQVVPYSHSSIFSFMIITKLLCLPNQLTISESEN